ncbi:MAG: hypothetical protein JWP97_4623 [Labilithrix sp.]|nr:hypothetical protein [Labilithrix sp.]
MRLVSLASAASVALGAGVLLHVNLAAAQEPTIAPPPPMDPSAVGTDPNAVGSPEAQTSASLNQAEREDSGRNFELFYVDGMVGGSYINMRQFSSDTLQIQKAESGGPMFSLGAGVRFVILVAGVRARYNALSAFNMWQLNAEVGLKIPISKLDFLVGLHGGYSFVGKVDDGTVSASSTPTNNDAVKVRGWNAGLDVALDYYVSPNFSVGVGVFGDGLFLKRPPVDLPAGVTKEQVAADPEAAKLYEQSGTSAGLQFGGGLRLGGHFGL